MPINRTLAAAARETSSVEFAQAVGALQRAARRIVAFWDDIDIVLTPALAKLPVPVGWVFEPDDPWEQFTRGGEFTPFTPIVNVTGQPAAAVPFDVVDGLPAGIQLIGPPAGEAVLFRLAAQLEAAHPWAPDRLPLIEAESSSASSSARARVLRDHEARVVARERADDERVLEPVECPRDRRRRADLGLDDDEVLGDDRAPAELVEQAVEDLSRVDAPLAVRQDVAQPARAGHATSRGRARGCRARRSPA